MRTCFIIAAAAAAGLASTASAKTVVVNASLHATAQVFNTVDYGFDAGRSSPNTVMRTNVFDAGGARQPWIKFSGVDAALATAGKTKADVVSARFELTVQDFDTEVGVFTWTLFGVNDGVANENFSTGTPWDLMPGVIAALRPSGAPAPAPLPGQVPVYTSQDPTETVVLGSINRSLVPFGPRPASGTVDGFDLPLSFITGDTNDVYTFMFHQTEGENINFRPQWWGTGAAAAVQPRLIMVVPEPTTLGIVGGAGLLAMARRRR